MPVLVTPDIAAAAGPHGVRAAQRRGRDGRRARSSGSSSASRRSSASAVVADLGQAETRLDTLSPGLGTTDELWLDAPAPPTAPTLTVTSRAATAARLHRDPLARGALLTLAGDRRSSRCCSRSSASCSRSSATCATSAASSSTSRRRAPRRRRSAPTCACALSSSPPSGSSAASSSARSSRRSCVSLVSVTASAAEPEPPLRLSLDLPLLGLAAVVYVAAAVLLVGAATTLRGRAPSRAAEVTA